MEKDRHAMQVRDKFIKDVNTCRKHALRVIEAFTACYYSSIRPLCSNSSKVVLLFFTSVLPGFDALLPQALSASGKRCESTGKCMRVVIFTCMGMNPQINTGVKQEEKEKAY